mmetsp:Transcript_3890/g.5144  ORF Transcript_3890/g.5144 Transcript_3890/m.5144 type:complete len:81 (+) Transcript_3890:83-325(+)
MGNSQDTPKVDSVKVEPPVKSDEPASKIVYGKSGKKICCSCPDTKKARDECIVTQGEEACAELISAHKACLRAEGFTVKE